MLYSAMKSFGVQLKRTSFRGPWQNGIAERWVGPCDRGLLDHVIALNRRHLKRLNENAILAPPSAMPKHAAFAPHLNDGSVKICMLWLGND